MGKTSGAGFSVSWQGHSSTVCTGLQQLQQRSELVDMTLAADGHIVRAHQVVVGLASPFLKELIRLTPTQHPVIFLNNISHKVLCCILEYMYTGEVVVPAEELRNFVTAGKSLNIRGLREMYVERFETDAEQTPSPLASTHTSDVVAAATALGSFSSVQTEHIAPVPDALGESVTDCSTTSRKFSRKHKVALDIPELAPSRPSKMFKTDVDINDDARNNSPEIANDDIQSDDDAFEDIYESTQSTSTHSDQDDQEQDNSTKKPKLMYTISNMGGIQLILNRYIYRLRHVLKNGRRQWQCVNYKLTKCTAQAFVEDDGMISRCGIHNHPFHDKKIIEKVRRKLVFSSIDAIQDNQSAEDKVA